MLFRFLALVLLSLFSVYWLHIRLTPEDISAYEKLLLDTSRIRERRVLKDKIARQERFQTKKDLWIENETKKITIESKSSSLALSQEKNHVAIVETFSHLAAQLPEGYTLFADKGTYRFPAHQFTAEENCLLTQGESRISADKMHFDLAKQTISCSLPEGELAEGLKFSGKTLTWDKKENKLYLDQEVRLISKDRGKQSFAIADRLVYNLSDETILLSSQEKVLFWQEGLRLSASEVLIHRNKEEETVKGKGDVHFCFTMEEQSLIDEIFKQYL